MSPSVVVIVGASSGIGRACAHRFAARGCSLVLASRSEPALDAVATECRQRGAHDVRVVATDVLEEEAVQRLVDTAIAAHGRIDTVVFSAGVMAYGTIEDVPSRVFRTVVDTPVHGTANVARAVLPPFRKHDTGTLVVVTSLLASVPVPMMGAYITGKWGQLALARILQLELRRTPNVNVCTVAPGAVDTPIYRRAANYAGRAGKPPPPVATPERIAEAVVGCADHPRRNVAVGHANRLVTLGFRILPPLYDALVTPLFTRAGLSATSVEPTDGNVFAPERPTVPVTHH